MAIISEAVEKFRTVAAATLTTSKELSDAYNLPLNIDARLASGWGVTVTGGIPSPTDELCSQIITAYTISLVLTEDITREQSSDTGLISSVKSLYDKEILFRTAIYTPNLLLANSFAQLIFESVSAPEFIDQVEQNTGPLNDFAKFISITSTFSLRAQD